MRSTDDVVACMQRAEARLLTLEARVQALEAAQAQPVRSLYIAPPDIGSSNNDKRQWADKERIIEQRLVVARDRDAAKHAEHAEAIAAINSFKMQPTRSQPDAQPSPHFGKLGMPIKDAAAALGVSLTTMYEWVRSGAVETILVGRRRLVLTASLQAYIERQRTAKYQPRAVPWGDPAAAPGARTRRRRLSPAK